MKLLGFIFLFPLLTLISGKSSFFPLMPITDSAILKCLKNSGYMDLAFTYMNYGNSDHMSGVPLHHRKALVILGLSLISC